jgi:hypothetical protein
MRFYVLEADGGRVGTKWAYGKMVKPAELGDSDNCPVHGGPVSSLRWLPPHVLNLSSAKPEKWGDILWGDGFRMMFSAKLKSIFLAEGLSGVAEFSPPAKIVRLGMKKAAEIPPPLPVYHLVYIPWGGANQDDAASEVVFDRPHKITCQYCRAQTAGRKQARVVIEEGSWNGADIFVPRGFAGALLVSERFKQMAEHYQMKNILLIPAEKYGYDEHRAGSGQDLWYVNEQQGSPL